MHHTATAIAVSPSKVVVVVFGGLYELISDRDRYDQPMRSDTSVLEFGNYDIIRMHLHTELFVCVAMQSCSRVGVVRRSGV